MKLSKSYSLKKSKSDEIISFHFQLLIFIIEKLLPDSTSRGVSEYDNFGLFLRPTFNHRFIQRIIDLLLKIWLFASKVYL
jgi:hypothetical protein